MVYVQTFIASKKGGMMLAAAIDEFYKSDEAIAAARPLTPKDAVTKAGKVSVVDWQ